jgi:hypothetical protein
MDADLAANHGGVPPSLAPVRNGPGKAENNVRLRWPPIGVVVDAATRAS